MLKMECCGGSAIPPTHKIWCFFKNTTRNNAKNTTHNDAGRCFELQDADESTRQPVGPLDQCQFVTAPNRPRDGSHQCARPTDHSGPHTCECGDIWERGEKLTGYRCLTYQSSEPVIVGEIPPVMLMSLEMLQRRASHGISVMNGDVITMGRHAAGGMVWYRVIGWDMAQAGLILSLDADMYHSTKGIKPS